MEGATNVARKKKFTWSEQQTSQFVELRIKHEAHFTGHRYASIQGFNLIIKEMGMEEQITASQANKKWENLKKKYWDLILPKIGFGAEAGLLTAGSWPFFEAMHRAMGQRGSNRPINVISTAVDSEAEDIPAEEPSTSAPEPATTPGPCSTVGPSTTPGLSSTVGPSSTPGLSSTAGPFTTPGPSSAPRKRRKRNEVLEYLKEFMERQEKRQRELDRAEEEREKKRAEQLDAIIKIFGQLVEKDKN